MSQIVLRKDGDERFQALKAAEDRITALCRRTVDDAIGIGRELLGIRDKRLFEAVECRTFSEYVEVHLGWDYKSAHRLMNISVCAGILRSAGLALPANESQIAELARLPREKQALTYGEILERCEKKDLPVTMAIIHDTVQQEQKKSDDTEDAGRIGESGGIEIPDMSADLGSAAAGAKVVVRERMSLDEDGESALLRVRRLCGDPVGDAIEYMTVPMSQKELIKWADLPDEELKLMAHYLVHEGWSLTQALRYERRSTEANQGTTVEELVHWANSRGGYYALQHGAAIITVQIE